MVIADGVLMDPGVVVCGEARAFTGLRLLVESRDQLPEPAKNGGLRYKSLAVEHIRWNNLLSLIRILKHSCD